MSKKNSEEIVNQVGHKLLEWAETTESFAEAQVPKLIEEILMYNMATSIGLAVLSFLILLVVGSYWYSWYRSDNNFFYDCNSQIAREGKIAFSITFTIVAVLGPSITFFVQVLEALKIWLAPRLYVIEYLRELVEKGG